ncbi:arabinosyltransferase domain-containing protein [Amycolatopsis minnesotensis]|uniref:Arabinosyltransferase domain-containing protein n=1 Tax=Amycolatopsis minnesotensis TaxID=337894 RepID=A0ABP5BLJ9_9PSEU
MRARVRRRWLTAVACCAGALTILGALALPVAPVEVNDPSVSWPLVATAPESTLLSLEAGKPLDLKAAFSCRAVDAAAATEADRASRVVLATTDPDQPERAEGLRITAENGMLTAFLGTTVLFRDRVPASSCRYEIGAVDGHLVYTRDGQRLGTSAMPDVDALVTSITALPGPDLDVTVRVDDRFANSPAPLKLVLLGMVAISAVTAAACLLALHRRKNPRRKRRFRIGTPDVLVGAALVAWLFLAPRTSDDGWMYAMAENHQHAGYFGNYYMYHNNSYVPFTWLLRLYSWWLELGNAPVLLRAPSLLFGIVTWLAVRGAVAEVARGRRMFVPALLFLAWWLPFGLGTRQEASVAACLTVTVAAVLAARRRQRVAYLGLAVGAASLGLIAHTAGVLVVLPLALGAGAAVKLVRRTARSGAVAAATVVCVLSCAAVSAFAGFADGTLADFLRGSSSFGGGLETGPPDPLHDEFDRYRSLLGGNSLGNFALRTPVLLLLLVLPFFVVLCVRARRRRRPLPWALWLTGWTCALGLGLLVLTPSKWTWHFGAFAGVATIFLTWSALAGPGLVRRLVGDGRWTAVLGTLLLTGAAGWVLLSGAGRNVWADDVLPGVPLAGQPLLPGTVSIVVTGLVVAGAFLLRRRRGAFAPMSAATLVVACFLVAELGFLVGGFGVATARTWHTWSPWADAVRDPLAAQCGEARVLRVADPDSARPVEVASGAPVTDGFERNVWYSASPPEPGPATAEVYGNVPDESGRPARFTSPWLKLPSGLSARNQLMTTVSGQTGDGNSLTAEFATASGEVVATTEFSAAEDDIGWRDVSISRGENLPPGAVAFRLTAEVTRNWLSFAMPTARQVVPVGSALPRDGRTLVDWQLTWLYPCQGQPVLADGIVSPVSYAVGFGFGPDESEHAATSGGTWTPGVGGLLGPQLRSSTITRLYTVLDTDPGTPMRTVYRFTRPYADNAYRLRRGTTTAPGW